MGGKKCRFFVAGSVPLSTHFSAESGYEIEDIKWFRYACVRVCVCVCVCVRVRERERETTHYPLPTTHYPLPTTHYPLQALQHPRR
jgi:hypothetical protein